MDEDLKYRGKLKINMGKKKISDDEISSKSKLKVNMGKRHPKVDEEREKTVSRLKINMAKRIQPSELLERFEKAIDALEINTENYSLYPEVIGEEDAPPIATKIIADDLEVFINSVADGLWGSGCLKVIIDGNTLNHKGRDINHAYIASRTAHHVLSEIIKTDSQAFINNSLKEIFEKKLYQEFQKVKKMFGEWESKIKSKMFANYPTTLATSIIKKDKKSIKIECLSAGDSPIFIITPDCIYTSLEEGSGDDLLGNDVVCSDRKINLKHKELSFDLKTPIVIVNCSDGFVKFKDYTSNIEKIFEFLKIISSDNIVQKYKNWSIGKDADDSTISISNMTDNYETYNKLLENSKHKEIKKIF